VLYPTDNVSEAAARQISLIIGSARCLPFSEYKPEYQDAYEYIVIGGSLGTTGTNEIARFINTNCQWLAWKEVALFSLGGDFKTAGEQLSEIARPLVTNVLAIEHIPGGENGFDTADLVPVALHIRAKFRERRKKMPPEEVKKMIEDLLKSEPYLVLATGCGANIRATTIGYSYQSGHVYAFCEGAEKFANLLLNNRVALAFYRMPEKDGLQASGTATIVYPGTVAYREMCALLGKDHGRLVSLPFNLNGLDIKLHKVEYYRADLRGQGYESKQVHYF
jgi:hypothetical protein